MLVEVLPASSLIPCGIDSLSPKSEHAKLVGKSRSLRSMLLKLAPVPTTGEKVDERVRIVEIKCIGKKRGNTLSFPGKKEES
jgi:hypothetical protein